MTTSEWLTFLTSLVAILLIPAIVLLVRIVRKWTRTEDRLDAVATAVEKLVEDKDKIHQEMFAQMREDRNATNTRLRWLEENVWKSRGGGR